MKTLDRRLRRLEALPPPPPEIQRAVGRWLETGALPPEGSRLRGIVERIARAVAAGASSVRGPEGKRSEGPLPFFRAQARRAEEERQRIG
ncbi:MAG: hypothetical protein GF355_07020 [Candidatus Eisenbacteria bacterium]|nr:hypothetical protein [Candidatus Eisenbacteria bacterium]